MILTPRILARAVAAVAVALLVQQALLSQLVVAGTRPDAIPVIVVCFGLLGGSITGAGAGFAIGLAFDVLALQTLGISSLVLTVVGYLAGRIREVYDLRANSLLPALLCGGFTALAVAGLALIQLILGIEAPVSVLVLRDLAVKAILAFFLAPPIYLGLRRLLAPAIIDDAPARRRTRRPTPLRPV